MNNETKFTTILTISNKILKIQNLFLIFIRAFITANYNLLTEKILFFYVFQY